MELLTRSLRRFEAWVTGLRYRFEGDLFFRTTLYVIAVQVALVLISVVAFSWALEYTNREIIATISSHVNALIQHYPVGGTSTLPASIDAIQSASVRYVFAGVIILSALFGVILAYITLRPARSSLEYQKLFISNVAHELRTPLSTIKTSTEVMLLDEGIAQNVRENLTSSLEELDRISGIINNLLSLNAYLRPERMEFSNVDLRPLIDAVVARTKPLAEERIVEIRTKTNDYSVVWGNGSALEQVVSNVLRNAIIYSPRGKQGVITISVHPGAHGMVVLSVSDNGIGIAQEDLFHIFEPFYRADQSRFREASIGSGLGLAIVSEIVRVHKGQIRIQSTPGKGTTVSILLPAGTAPSASSQNGEENEGVNEVSVDFSRGA